MSTNGTDPSPSLCVPASRNGVAAMRNILRGVLRHIDHTQDWPASLDPGIVGGLNHHAQVWLRRAEQAARHAYDSALMTILPAPGHTPELLRSDWIAHGAVLAQDLMRASGTSVNDTTTEALRRAICAGYAWRLGESVAYGQFSAGTDSDNAVGLATAMQRAALWGRLAVSPHRPTFRHVTNALLRTPSWDAGHATQLAAPTGGEQRHGWSQTFTAPRTSGGRDVLVVSGSTEINADPACLLLNGRPYPWPALCNRMAGAPLAD